MRNLELLQNAPGIDAPPPPPRREFTICRDRHGHWLAVENHGLLGGVFISLKAAERFALREAGDDPERVHVAAKEEASH
jgi:hypothetical protein